jgi:photosystem II stability/assembly factor-like uncharacterized protein
MINVTTASAQWSYQTNPLPGTGESTMVGKVQFVSSTEGWISAVGGNLLHTTNGGSTWSKSIVASGTGILGAQLQFVDANNGFATAGNMQTGTGYLYKTTNGGATWTTVTTFTAPDEVQLFYFLNTTTGWTLKINDDYGNPAIFQISKTTDGGVTWTPVTSSLTSGLNAYQKCMFMYDANHVWVGVDIPSSMTGYATSHFVMHTADGGVTWVQENISLPTNPFSLFFLNGNTGWLTTDYTGSLTNKGVIAAYNNSGITFSNASLNGPWLARIFNPDTYLIFDRDGRITELGAFGGVTGSVIGNYSVTSYGGLTGNISIGGTNYPLAGQFITADSISVNPGLTTTVGSLSKMNPNTLQGNWTGSIPNSTNNYGSIALSVNSSGQIISPTTMSGSIFTKDGEVVGFINDTNGGNRWDMMQINGTYSPKTISGTAQSSCTDTSGPISLTLNTTPVNNTAVSTVQVSVQNHQAVVAGVGIGEYVAVYSVQGLTVYNQKAKATTVMINLPSKGLYVVSVGTQNFKIVNN